MKTRANHIACKKSMPMLTYLSKLTFGLLQTAMFNHTHNFGTATKERYSVLVQ